MNAKRFQLLIFTEGKSTEPTYFTHWHRQHRDRILVQIAPHSFTSPLQLVQAAISQKARDTKEAKRGRGDAFDEYWCVFDVDEHPRIPEALNLATAHDIKIAISNPCIELWFLIHFEDQTSYLTRQQAQRRSKQHLKCGKLLDQAALQSLEARYEAAKNRAVQLAEKHDGDGSPHYENPSSGLWKIIDAIRLS
jgi:hypothetical protein